MNKGLCQTLDLELINYPKVDQVGRTRQQSREDYPFPSLNKSRRSQDGLMLKKTQQQHLTACWNLSEPTKKRRTPEQVRTVEGKQLLGLLNHFGVTTLNIYDCTVQGNNGCAQESSRSAIWAQIDQILSQQECLFIPRPLLHEVGVESAVTLTKIHSWYSTEPADSIGTLQETLRHPNRRSVSRLLNKLAAQGYVEQENLSSSRIVQILKEKNIGSGHPNAQKKCDWCKATTFVLHDHHYPIPKSKGGQEVVGICPTCHCEFHFLETTKTHRLTEKSLAFFGEVGEHE